MTFVSLKPSYFIENQGRRDLLCFAEFSILTVNFSLKAVPGMAGCTLPAEPFFCLLDFGVLVTKKTKGGSARRVGGVMVLGIRPILILTAPPFCC